jgi:hypothetical protein
MLQYKGYMISGCSIPIYTKGCQLRGSVCRAGRSGSIIELQRIDGEMFKATKERHMDWSWEGNG